MLDHNRVRVAGNGYAVYEFTARGAVITRIAVSAYATSIARIAGTSSSRVYASTIVAVHGGSRLAAKGAVAGFDAVAV